MAASANEPPSRDRTVPGSVNITPFENWPSSSTSENVDATSVAEGVVAAFNEAAAKKDWSGIANLFLADNSFWRDHLALTWNLRTLEGRDKIREYLESSTNPIIGMQLSTTAAHRAPHHSSIDAWGDLKGIEFFVQFETAVGRGEGVVKLAEGNGSWKIFMMSTVLQELKGYEEPKGARRPMGVKHGQNLDRKNWKETREKEINFEETEPKVLIVGAGQGGLTVAARLKMLGIPALIIDSNERVGDNWRKRYHQLVLHDPVWYDHMPYIPFPPHWPIFTPKDKLAEWFESYVNTLELNVWTSSTLKSSSWDESKKLWSVTVERKKTDGTVETRTLHPRHIIQATGHSGKKNFPSIKGMNTFKGDRLCHSSEFPGASAGSQGKKAIVVGSCNSGHDIAHDFFEKGYDVTMVQRSTTCVISSEAIMLGMKGLYEEGAPPVEDADLILHALPSSVFKSQQIKLTRVQNEHDKEVLDGLRKVGFGLDCGPHDAGLLMKYYQRGGGYYIDVGASKLIADGKIKVKQGQEISQILPHAIEFADGTQLPADEIVFATGYQNMRTEARLIFGNEVADKLADVWGLNEEGEFKSIWQRQQHPGFWMMGGNLALSRYYSRILALQIKAIEEDLLK